jgi:hypothetical protein
MRGDMNDVNWWKKNLDDYYQMGRKDADKGLIDYPHAYDDSDPQYMDENQAYKEGFKDRRRELGNKFKWAYEK